MRVHNWPTLLPCPHHSSCSYWCIIINSTAPAHHMTVDPEQVAGVLRKELGQRSKPQDSIMVGAGQLPMAV